MSESWTQDIRGASLDLDQQLWEGFFGWWQVEYLDGVTWNVWNVSFVFLGQLTRL